VYVVGQAFASKPGRHWIVRHSATGETGSWSVSDDFAFKIAASSALQGASASLKMADGSVTSLPPAICGGTAIVGDTRHLFAGGSAFAGSSHAIVRKLELDGASELTKASGR
jgi:hypothetical protein